MSAEESIVKVYARANDPMRINIIFEHFDNFISMVDMFEEDLHCVLKEEKRINKRDERGDTGVRVQTSVIGDPTGNEATNNVQLMRDMQSGSIAEALKGADDDIDHETEIMTLRMMRSDYRAINKAIEQLKPGLRADLKEVLNGAKDLTDLAEDGNSSYNAAKQRMNRARGKVRRLGIVYMRRDRAMLA